MSNLYRTFYFRWKGPKLSFWKHHMIEVVAAKKMTPVAPFDQHAPYPAKCEKKIISTPVVENIIIVTDYIPISRQGWGRKQYLPTASWSPRAMRQITLGLYSLSSRPSCLQISWSRRREIGCYNYHIALKFNRHFGSTLFRMINRV